MSNPKRKNEARKGAQNGRRSNNRKGVRSDPENTRDRRDRQSGDDGRRFDRNANNGKLSTLNDLSWYARYPELLQAAGQIPYPWRPGMSMPMGTILPSAAIGTREVFDNIPGVLTVEWVPTVGISDNVTSPASIACKEIYSKVRKSYSGSLEADPPDFLVYLMALDSIFAAIGAMKRVFRIVNAYTPQNYYIPDGLILALTGSNATAENWRSNKMYAFGAINELVHMTQKFMCPATMDIFNRHYWMNDNVYSDAPSLNSQLYAYKMTYMYTYAEQNTPDSVAAAGLQYTALDLTSPTNAYTVIRNAIRALSSWDDSYTISGYLMRAYEGAPVFSVAPLAYDEPFDIAYVPEVLSQFENTVCVPDPAGFRSQLVAGAYNVSQDPTTNIILSNLVLTYGDGFITTKPDFFTYEFQNMKPLINIHSEMPTVEDTVIATRMKSWVVDVDAAGKKSIFKIICGTEVPIAIGLYTTNQGQAIAYTNEVKQYVAVPQGLNPFPSAAVSALMVALRLRRWDWAPLVSLQVVNGLIESIPSWESYNETTVDVDNLQRLHEVCIYSEFNAFNE